MAYKPVGVDDNNKFPSRVITALTNLFVSIDASGNISSTVLNKFKSKFATIDSNSSLSAAVIATLRPQFTNANLRHSPRSSTGTVYWGIPGAALINTSTSSTAANTMYYYPFTLRKTTRVTALALELTTASTAGSLEFGIYAADINDQPINAPLYDSGAVSFSATGVITKDISASPLTLPPGNYLAALNSTQAISVRSFLSTMSGPIVSLGSTPYATRYLQSVTAPTMPATPVKWTSTSSTSTSGRINPIAMQWIEV